MKKKIIIVILTALAILIAILCRNNFKIKDDFSQNTSDLYSKTVEFLNQEFHRVYDQYYDIQSLSISNWEESENEATFFYKMTFLYYNRDPDTVEYIQKAKEQSQEAYETLYNDYLEEKEGNYEFKVVMNEDNIELYSNIAPKGTEWVPTKIDDYIMSNWD